MPKIEELDISFEYNNKSFKICKYIVSMVGILFEIEDMDGKHINFFSLKTICNNAKENLQREYPEFFV